MDGLQFVRKQAVQDAKIAEVTNEVQAARTSPKQTYANLKARLDDMEKAATDASDKIDAAITGLQWKESVDTFGSLAVKYPAPQEGWTASVNDSNKIYRYDEIDAEWKEISGGVAVDTSKFLKTDGGPQTMDGPLTATAGFVGDVTGNATSSDKVNNKLVINGTEYDGSAQKDFDLAEKVHTHGTNEVDKLAGYNKGLAGATALAATDTLNMALAKLENRVDAAAGGPAPPTPTGAEIILTGKQDVVGSPADIKDTDNTNDAFVKVEEALRDHEHSYAGSQAPGGAADSAVKLETERAITLKGAVVGTVTFDGTQDVEIDVSSNLKVNITKLRSDVTITDANKSSVPSGETLTPDDIVDVYLSGVKLEPINHYDIIGDNIVPKPDFLPGDRVTIEILRAELVQ